MILYHGSYADIKKIDLSLAEKGKDFGKGFYTTTIREHAVLWAERQGKRLNCAGFISVFNFDYDRAFLSGQYNTKIFEGYTFEWLDFVKVNRTNYTDNQVHDYDIIEGPIADDKVNRNMPRYESGEMSAEEFLKMLKYDGSHQICFCTQKSLDTIKRMDLKAHFKIEDICSLVTKCLGKNDHLSEEEIQDLFYESETYDKLSDESSLLHLKPWQEIYSLVKIEMEKAQAKSNGDNSES
jgi:hypothetical protein